MRRLLILGRGFLESKAISQCKEHYGIGILVPIRLNLDVYADAIYSKTPTWNGWRERAGGRD
jgi:hypothetical protein